MQRRIWTESANGVIYPNLYILLVAPPGVGKSETIKRVGELWRGAGENSREGLHVAPNSVTRAALIDVLSRSTVKSILPSGDLQLFHGLNVAASEFGVLCPAHDLEFLNTLNDIFDCGASFSEERRHRKGEQIDIKYPILNILGGTQPGFLSELLPEQAWNMGFTSRLLMIYSATPVKVNLFGVGNPLEQDAKRKSYDDAQRELQRDLTAITQLYGAVQWSPEAAATLVQWHTNGLPPIPTHGRLQHYNTRRLLTVFKLAMVASVSRGNDLTVLPEDLTRVQDWLLPIEDRMPDIFRDMAGRSDKQVIDDLHDFMWRMYVRTQQKPIHESLIIQFLQSKVPSEKVLRVLDLCHRSGIIEKAPEFEMHWRPSVKDSLPGIE